MARVQYGSLITEFKGSIGGTCFQSNASGAIARNKVNRLQNDYAAQQYPKYVFAAAVAQWQVLNAISKAEWNSLAASTSFIDRWGLATTVTGFQLFVSLYCNQINTNESPLLYAPAVLVSLPVISFTVAVNLSDIVVNFVETFDHTVYSLLIFSSVVSKSVSLFNRKSVRLVSYISSGVTDSINITAAWESYFQASWPLPGVNQSYGIFICICSVENATGFASPFQKAFGIVVT